MSMSNVFGKMSTLIRILMIVCLVVQQLSIPSLGYAVDEESSPITQQEESTTANTTEVTETTETKSSTAEESTKS